MHPSPNTRKGVAGFIKPPAAAPRSTISYSSSNISIARGEMDVASTTVRDVTGHDLFTFGEAARAALALVCRLSSVVTSLGSLVSSTRPDLSYAHRLAGSLLRTCVPDHTAASVKSWNTCP